MHGGEWQDEVAQEGLWGQGVGKTALDHILGEGALASLVPSCPAASQEAGN